MLRSRRWALTSLGSLLLGALLVPSIASAKKRRRPKKKAAAPEPAPEAAGDALKDAQLVKREERWYLKNRSQSQRIIVALRIKRSGSTASSIDAYVLEPNQEVAVAGTSDKPTIASARYDG